jgi:hypothetical protein
MHIFFVEIIAQKNLRDTLSGRAGARPYFDNINILTEQLKIIEFYKRFV